MYWPKRTMQTLAPFTSKSVFQVQNKHLKNVSDVFLNTTRGSLLISILSSNHNLARTVITCNFQTMCQVPCELLNLRHFILKGLSSRNFCPHFNVEESPTPKDEGIYPKPTQLVSKPRGNPKLLGSQARVLRLPHAAASAM